MNGIVSQITDDSQFVEPYVQAHRKEDIKATRHWAFVRRIHHVTGWFPSQRTSNA